MSVKGKKAKHIAGGISKIQELVDKEKNAKVRDGYRAMLWSNQAMSQTQIAKNLNKTRETIRSWIKKWNRNESLEDRERSGRPVILSKEEKNQVVEYVKERKYTGRITCKNICNWVLTRLDKQISKESIRNILKKARLSWKKPGKVDYRRNEAESKEFIEFLKKRKEKRKDTQFWYLDEIFIPSISYDWMPTNTRIKIKSHLSREKEYIIGGVHPESGTSCYFQSNEMNSDITALFLQEVSRKYPDEKIVFILDNVKYHVTQGNSDYPLPKNIELLFLPAYSPDLNLQERVWNHLKTEYVNNNFFPNVEELSFTINKGLRELLYKPELLKSICSIA